jgi:uncharacterized protein (DUF1684 family)
VTKEAQELADFRAEKDAFMRESHHSPLPEEERGSFQGLSYFPFNPDLIVEAPLDTNVSEEPVTMETSTGSSRTYRRAGKVRFEVEDQPAEVTIYTGPEGDLFLPIRDATSGKESYGAGRYLEPEPLGDGQMRVDFNYLYNPYCAYSERWSCPLPPVENWLRVPIQAGEKVYHQA